MQGTVFPTVQQKMHFIFQFTGTVRHITLTCIFITMTEKLKKEAEIQQNMLTYIFKLSKTLNFLKNKVNSTAYIYRT